jgi:nucleoside 2-deoxyribosyltransferase
MNKVYIASKYSRKNEMRHDIAPAIRHAGIEVTSRWHDIEETGSSWEKAQKEYDVRGEGHIDREHGLLKYYATIDLEDVDAADAIVLFSEDPTIPHLRGGRHVEFGYAMGKGKTCYVVGMRENIFHFIEDVIVCDSVEAFVTEYTKRRDAST